MSRSVEHIVETHRIAAARRAQGRPIWERKIRLGDIWGNQELTFEQRRDAIAARLRASGWYADDSNHALREAVDNLAEAEDADEFDGWWDEIYDHADIDRVWIDIWGGA